MKIFRNVLIALFSLSALLTVSAIYISSYMQGYWKGKLGEIPERTQEFLDKKNFWVAVGETKFFAFLTFVLLVLLLITILIIWLKRKK